MMKSACVLIGVLALGIQGVQADDKLLAKGKTIYNGIGACASCHGPEGKGDGAASAALNPKPRSFAAGDFVYDPDKDGKKGTGSDISAIITNGAAKYGGSPLMAARPDIKGDDLKALVAYVKSLKKAK